MNVILKRASLFFTLQFSLLSFLTAYIGKSITQGDLTTTAIVPNALKIWHQHFHIPPIIALGTTVLFYFISFVVKQKFAIPNLFGLLFLAIGTESIFILIYLITKDLSASALFIYFLIAHIVSWGVLLLLAKLTNQKKHSSS